MRFLIEEIWKNVPQSEVYAEFYTYNWVSSFQLKFD